MNRCLTQALEPITNFKFVATRFFVMSQGLIKGVFIPVLIGQPEGQISGTFLQFFE